MEEWNEYGELKEHVSPGAVAPTVTTTLSTPSTPSKPAPSSESPSKVRFTAETPTKASQAAATGSPRTIAMRQAGAEAAKKASDTKSQARAKILGDSQVSDGIAKKLDSSTTPGLPPPSGTTEAADAISPETVSTTTKFTADDAKTTEPLTELRQNLGSSGKGDSSSDVIGQSGSQVLSETNESSKQKGSPDIMSHAVNRSLEGGDSDHQIISREASDKGKHETEEQVFIKREKEISGGSNPGS